MQGFQLCHALGGGTGSGLGSLILSKLKEDYDSKIVSNYSVFPSTKVSDIVLEPYNTVLSMNQLVENSDFTVAIDNEALYDICKTKLIMENSTFSDLNHVASLAICGITANFRFPGQQNGDLRKIATNLIPFPRLHFLIPTIAPLSSKTSEDYTNLNEKELVEQIFDTKNLLCSVNAKSDRYLTAAVIFRGKLSMNEIDTQISSFRNKYSANFVE